VDQQQRTGDARALVKDSQNYFSFDETTLGLTTSITNYAKSYAKRLARGSVKVRLFILHRYFTRPQEPNEALRWRQTPRS